MASKTFSELGVLGLYIETPLHCGAEGGTGYVDLPIQRERHTQYPVIPGSTVKGVLRDELRESLGDEGVTLIFGKDDAQSPGAVSFGDGILVAFPVRSSEAPFHWITCPFVLERVSRVLGASFAVNPPEAGSAWTAGTGSVLLEEIRLEKKALPSFFTEKDGGFPHLLRLLPADDRGFAYTRKLFAERLLIVSDADFKELVETSTEVVTRIKLNALGTTTNIPDGEHKEIEGTDRQGNLFVEELVPPEALFLSPLRAGNLGADFVGALRERPVIRLGGDETIGRGVTHMTFVSRKGEEG